VKIIIKNLIYFTLKFLILFYPSCLFTCDNLIQRYFVHNIIKFFLSNTRLNYMLFAILLLLGLYSFEHIPRDVFPKIKIDKIIVSGNYEGASARTLDKIAVNSLEKEFRAINGIGKIESFIQDGEFSTLLNVEQSDEKILVLNKVKQVISNYQNKLPKDMDEPTAQLEVWSMPLIDVTVASNSLSKQQLIEKSKQIKDELSTLVGISKVELYEDTSRVFEIILDSQKIELYDLNKTLLIQAIKDLSYIYPLGKIQDKKEHLYLSTNNGKKEVSQYLNTQIKIENKTIYLSDIASITKQFKKVDVITQVNGKQNIVIGISKNDKANAITLVALIKEKIEILNSQFKDLEVSTSFDNSVYINKRLNTVVSGILFGLILVGVCIYILVNKRVAFIVVLGIPTAILFGLSLLYLTGYSINMMSLIGVLLVLGILVDDAVIIAENIQRHIVLGENKFEATIRGTKEVLPPVLAASFTTIFAFFPMMMLSGELGEFLKIIPIAIVVLIVASVLESFIFLPLHSFHVLKKEDKELDWSKAQHLYSRVLHLIIRHRIKFLLFFTLVIPTLTFLCFSSMKYQMMPEVDSNLIFIKGKFDQSHTVQETFEEARILEEVLLKHKESLAINNISFLSGLSFDNQGSMEIKPSIFQFNIELHEKRHEDLVNKYLVPFLSFQGPSKNHTRVLSVDESIKKIKRLLKEFQPQTLKELSIKKESSGVTENDIEILLSSQNKDLMKTALSSIKKHLQKKPGIVFVQDSASQGIKELKLRINSYGESLGFTESSLAFVLNALYLKNQQNKGLDSQGIFEVLTFEKNKDDFNTLYNLEVSIPQSKKQIALNEICDFLYIKNYNSISKTNQNEYQMIFANVDNKITTAQEVLKSLEVHFSDYREQGIIITLEGEEEQNAMMFKQMTFAIFVSASLIFITLLLMFNSFIKSFMILSIIPFSILGAIIGHMLMGLNFSLPSVVGITGLSGVVINDAIVMLDFIKKSQNLEEMMGNAILRLRPIIITSVTTFLGLSTLIFYATGQAKILQPIAISLGFGLLWGTVLTLLYLPALFAVFNKFKRSKH